MGFPSGLLDKLFPKSRFGFALGGPEASVEEVFLRPT